MNEVEKMYENAGVEPDYDYFTLFDDKVHKIGRTMHLCKEELKHWLENYQKDYVAIKVIRVDKDYPPFTAEKQLELIKWLSTKELKIRTNKQPYAIYVGVLGNDNTCFYGCEGLYLEQTLSELINSLWQDLTEEERKQTRGILE